MLSNGSYYYMPVWMVNAVVSWIQVNFVHIS